MLEESQSADYNSERWIIAALDLLLTQSYKAVTFLTDSEAQSIL